MEDPRSRIAVVLVVLVIVVSVVALATLAYLIEPQGPQPPAPRTGGAPVVPAMPDDAVPVLGAPGTPGALGRVPYIVDPRTAGDYAYLWANANCSTGDPIQIPKGTKCTVLESKELADGKRFRVRAVSGEEGWLREQCLEFPRR